MSTVIKAGNQVGDARPVAFNFDDMASKAGAYLDGVRTKADQILREARRRAEQDRREIEEEARRKGYEQGRKEAHKIVEEQLARQMATLLPALSEVIREVQDARHAWLARWEKNAVKLAVSIAGRMVRKELARDPQIPLELLRQSLEMAVGGSTVRVFLSPADLEALRPRAEALVGAMTGLGECQLAADPRITPGGCRVETSFGTIDQQIETQMRRIEEELT